MKHVFGRRQILLACAPVIAALSWVSACTQVPAPAPVVEQVAMTGPVTGGDKGWIYRAPVLDLDALGYVMEEYLVSGDARSFKLVEGTQARFDGNWQTEVADTAPFTTRIFVLRPVDPKDYNGVLLAHWQNVSAGFENGGPSGEEVLGGYAWMGVSAQAMGIYGRTGTEQFSLKGWDPARYGTLEHPGDAYSYDIYTKAVSAALERSAKGQGGPLGELKTDTVIAVGGSQSAWRLASYINGVHEHAQVFDGFLLLAHFGLASPVELSAAELFDFAGGGKNARWSQIADRGDVPVLVIDTQAEALMHYPARQADTDSFRLWEVAGAPHTPPSTIEQKELSVARDGIPSQDDSGRNIVEWDYVKDAGIRALVKWIRGGEAPAKFDPIAVEMTSRGPAYVTDELGNVKGGIRPPEVEVAVGVHTAGLPQPNLLGRSELFDTARLTELHGNRENFIAAWNRSVETLSQQGLLLPVQADMLRQRADVFWPKD